MRGIDGFGVTAKVREDPFNDRRRRDAGDDAQPAAVLPAGLEVEGVFLGAITNDGIARTVQRAASVDVQTMVGASKDERALCSPVFTVRKRMPWLQINLITAFVAAAVVGAFESTIAQVTALAVLLPVVAG